MANGAVYDENGSVKVIHSRKLYMLEDMIEAANGKPILVAYWFAHDKSRLLERFPEAVPIDTEDIINALEKKDTTQAALLAAVKANL